MCTPKLGSTNAEIALTEFIKTLLFPQYQSFTSFYYNLQSSPHTGFTKYN